MVQLKSRMSRVHNLDAGFIMRTRLSALEPTLLRGGLSVGLGVASLMAATRVFETAVGYAWIGIVRPERPSHPKENSNVLSRTAGFAAGASIYSIRKYGYTARTFGTVAAISGLSIVLQGGLLAR